MSRKSGLCSGFFLYPWLVFALWLFYQAIQAYWPRSGLFLGLTELRSLNGLALLILLGLGAAFNRGRSLAWALACYLLLWYSSVADVGLAGIGLVLASGFIVSRKSLALPSWAFFRELCYCLFIMGATFLVEASARIDLAWSALIAAILVSWWTLLAGQLLQSRLHWRNVDLDTVVVMLFAAVSWPGFEASDIGKELLFLVGTSILIYSELSYLFHLAYVDPLTGVSGRRALDEHLQFSDAEVILAMVDIDHFKNFNDTHGHDVGDQVLKAVASKLNGVEARGSLFRYGGEEFTLVFPATASEGQVLAELERLREAIENYSLILRSEDRPSEKPKPKKSRKVKPKDALSVTISLGWAKRRQGEPTDKLVKRADKALYQAKAGGRNRVAKAN